MSGQLHQNSGLGFSLKLEQAWLDAQNHAGKATYRCNRANLTGMLCHDVSKWSAISCQNEVLGDVRADSKRVLLCKLQCVGAAERSVL